MYMPVQCKKEVIWRKISVLAEGCTALLSHNKALTTAMAFSEHVLNVH